jgi:3'-phosphoadenosine 5'-phosphosulfate sulfotransferase (PAPS reductase)/FAD synthetase
MGDVTRFDMFNPRPAEWEPTADAHALLAGAIEMHNPSSVWALFSGGHDSLCATHIAAQHPRFTGVVHIATGIGIKETRRYVYETCKRYGWPLLIYRPRKKDRYEQFVRAHGMPGPAQHGRMYQRLKERSLRRHLAAHRVRGQRIVVVTGCRESESRRRMGHAEPVQREGRTVWVAACISWETRDQHAYMERHGLPRNAVKDHLCISGECLCGAFANGQKELEEIEIWYPDAADEVRRYERMAADAGKPCRWGERPVCFIPGDPAQVDSGIASLCQSCDNRRTRQEAA